MQEKTKQNKKGKKRKNPTHNFLMYTNVQYYLILFWGITK